MIPFGAAAAAGSQKHEWRRNIVINVCAQWGAFCWAIVAMLTLFSSSHLSGDHQRSFLTCPSFLWTHHQPQMYVFIERRKRSKQTFYFQRIIKYFILNRSFVAQQCLLCPSCVHCCPLFMCPTPTWKVSPSRIIVHSFGIPRRDIISRHSSS